MGLVAGAIAKSIMKQGGGWGSTLGVGLLGGVVGGWLGDLVFNRGSMAFFSLWSWLLAIGGSCLVIWLWNALQRRSR